MTEATSRPLTLSEVLRALSKLQGSGYTVLFQTRDGKHYTFTRTVTQEILLSEEGLGKILTVVLMEEVVK